MKGSVCLERLRVRRGPTLAVDDVALTIAPGIWYGVIGANGAGKTSLLRALAGRLPIASGVCKIDGIDLATDREARARRIGFMPKAEMLPGVLTGREVLDLVARRAGGWREALGPLTDALELTFLLDRKIATCSAGMRQRIAIGCAFAMGHDLVILDEPFNSLDPVVGFDLRQALRVKVERDGLTLITALHDMMTFIAACDAGVLLGNGRVSLLLGGKDLAEGRADPVRFERHLIDVLRSHGLDGRRT